MIPTTEVELDQRKADQMMKLMEALEDHDDVQHVWANVDFEVEEADRSSGDGDSRGAPRPAPPSIPAPQASVKILGFDPGTRRDGLGHRGLRGRPV